MTSEAPLTASEIEEIKARAEKATAGPWHRGRGDMVSYDASGTIPFKNVYADDRRGGWHKPTNSPLPLTIAKVVDESALFEESGGLPISIDELFDNAAFIAHARTDIPRLLADLSAARRDNERLKEVIRKHVAWWDMNPDSKEGGKFVGEMRDILEGKPHDPT